MLTTLAYAAAVVATVVIGRRMRVRRVIAAGFE